MVSSDSGVCTASWRLVHQNYSCGNVAILVPSNDTRVNLMLLMADLHRAKNKAVLVGDSAGHPNPPVFAWDEIAGRFNPLARPDARTRR